MRVVSIIFQDFGKHDDDRLSGEYMHTLCTVYTEHIAFEVYCVFSYVYIVHINTQNKPINWSQFVAALVNINHTLDFETIFGGYRMLWTIITPPTITAVAAAAAATINFETTNLHLSTTAQQFTQ